MTFPSSRHAHVVGLGLIGGSLALALGELGWSVTGEDYLDTSQELALARGLLTATQMHPETTLLFIATPSSSVVETAQRFLRTTDDPALVVTDVAGVKGAIAQAIDDPRFIGGHPMAGSELRGLEGARADLFRGCTWVLTPTQRTDPSAYSQLHGVLRELGANVMALDFETHDRLVATASHLPHLVAGALMNEAAEAAESDGALLQLAAGGFRDMTRVSAGDPGIWPDILFQNAEAVTASLQGLQERLARLESQIQRRDRDGLCEDLLRAARARRALPGRGVHSDELAHLRVPVPDRPGVLADVTKTASELQVNIFDIEIAHSVEGQPGVLLLAVATTQRQLLIDALAAKGYRVVVEQPS